MSDITDVVKALTELAAALRSAARNAETIYTEYCDGRASAYHDAAGMVDAVMTGPAMQAALDQLDARTAEAVANTTYIDQDQAASLVRQLTQPDRSTPTERL